MPEDVSSLEVFLAASSDLPDQTTVTRMVEGAKNGDAERLRWLEETFKTLVLRYVHHRYIGDARRDAIPGIVATVFERAARNIAEANDYFDGWLIWLARERLAELGQPDFGLVASARAGRVLHAAQTLPSEQQEFLVLRFVLGMDVASIRIAMGGCSARRIRQLRFSSINALQMAMRQE